MNKCDKSSIHEQERYGIEMKRGKRKSNCWIEWMNGRDNQKEKKTVAYQKGKPNNK